MSHRSGPASAIASTKLAIPRPPNGAIARDALATHIRQVDPLLVSVSAPAGFGKTTFLEQIRQAYLRRRLAVAWVNVDAADDEVTRFSQVLRAALSQALPDILDPVSGPLTGPSTGPTTANQLLDELSLIDAPFALFLDDFGWITEPAVLEVVNHLTAGLAEGQRLIVSSRTQPLLALGRLRARGRLLEIDADALRFSAEETEGYLLKLLGPRLSTGAVQVLQRRTEGWPAGLQLAAIALADVADPTPWIETFSGSEAAVAEYLAQDVLSRLSQEQRDFLLRSSVLPQFRAELCDFVLQIEDSRSRIEQAQRDNLFVSALEAAPGWYRYHAMFAEFLRARLGEEAPTLAASLQRRASLWYAEQGQFDDAIERAFAVPDPPLAVELLENYAMELVTTGRITTLVRWLDALPESNLRTHAKLLRAAGYAYSFAHRYRDAGAALEELERLGNETESDDLLAMRLMFLGWSDQIGAVVETVNRALRTRRSTDAFTTGLTLNAAAFVYTLLGRYVDAQKALAECRSVCEPIRAIYVLSYASCLQAAVELVCANVLECRQLLARAMARVVSARERYSSSGAVVATYLAEALYEQNELEASGALLSDLLPVIADTGMPDHLIVAYRTLVRIYINNDKRDQAFALAGELDDLGTARAIPRLRAAAWLEKGYLFLCAGDIENAVRAIRVGSGDPGWAALSGFELHAHDIEAPEVSLVRLLIAQGEMPLAVRAAEEALERAREARRIRRSLRLRFLHAIAVDAQGRHAEAEESLLAVLREGREKRLIRTFADEPSATQALWIRLEQRAAPTERSWIRELARAGVRRQHPIAQGQRRNHSDTSLLTARELQTLNLVAAGQTNKEVARSLFLTENTIETHLRRINAKLGTRTRTQALAKAREGGLI